MADRKKLDKKLQKELQEILRKCSKRKYIFRGENECYRRISSNLYRKHHKLIKKTGGVRINKNLSLLLEIEKSIVDRAKTYFLPGVSNIEVLTELQHHGGKTSLIDFTRDIHIALFFACNGNPKKDGRIILFDTAGIKVKKDIDYSSQDDYKIIDPTGKSPRVVFQSSVFVHATSGLIEKKHKRCKTIKIRKEFKRCFLNYLRENHHISESTVYNDIQGFIESQKEQTDAEKSFSSGIVCHLTGDNEKAVKYYGKAIALNPHYAAAYVNRGSARFDLKKSKKAAEEAIEDCNQAIKLSPKLAKAYSNRGSNNCFLGNYEKAIDDANQAIELDPKFARAYKMRSEAKYALGCFEEAIKDLERAKELDPNLAEVHKSRDK